MKNYTREDIERVLDEMVGTSNGNALVQHFKDLIEKIDTVQDIDTEKPDALAKIVGKKLAIDKLKGMVYRLSERGTKKSINEYL